MSEKPNPQPGTKPSVNKAPGHKPDQMKQDVGHKPGQPGHKPTQGAGRDANLGGH